MMYFAGTFSVALALLAFFYLHLQLFITGLPFCWLTNYKWKRASIQVLALVCFIAFFLSEPPTFLFGLILLCFGIPWLLSFLFSSSYIFKSLHPNHIIKSQQTHLKDTTIVVGISDGLGQSICYPLFEMIISRHIVNDCFLGEPIMITYCSACGSSILYSRKVDNQTLAFEVAPGLFKGNMLMTDTETGSIWQQGTGESIYGKWKGHNLNYKPYQQMTLSDWKILNPNTLIASESPYSPQGIFSQHSLAKILAWLDLLERPSKKTLSELKSNEPVLGIILNNSSKAYPISELLKSNRIYDSVGGITLEIDYNPETNGCFISEADTKKTIAFQKHRWAAWKEFHPQSEVWNKPVE